MSKTLVTYPDGSEFTTTHLAAGLAIGALGAAGITCAKEWMVYRKYRKARKNFRNRTPKELN